MTEKSKGLSRNRDGFGVIPYWRDGFHVGADVPLGLPVADASRMQEAH